MIRSTLEKCQSINENHLCYMKCSITISLYLCIFNLFCFDHTQRVHPQITKLQSKQKQAKYFLTQLYEQLTISTIYIWVILLISNDRTID